LCFVLNMASPVIRPSTTAHIAVARPLLSGVLLFAFAFGVAAFQCLVQAEPEIVGRPSDDPRFRLPTDALISEPASFARDRDYRSRLQFPAGLPQFYLNQAIVRASRDLES